MSANNPQPIPAPGNKEVTTEVIKDLLERSNIGREKYGTALMTHNGRNALIDAYQEVLDLAQYLKQELMEQEETAQFSPEELSMLELAVSNLLLSHEQRLFPVAEKKWNALALKLHKLIF